MGSNLTTSLHRSGNRSAQVRWRDTDILIECRIGARVGGEMRCLRKRQRVKGEILIEYGQWRSILRCTGNLHGYGTRFLWYYLERTAGERNVRYRWIAYRGRESGTPGDSSRIGRAEEEETNPVN